MVRKLINGPFNSETKKSHKIIISGLLRDRGIIHRFLIYGN